MRISGPTCLHKKNSTILSMLGLPTKHLKSQPHFYIPMVCVSFLVVCFQPMAQVHKTSWFMLHYNGPTPKRHYGFSNSRQVSQLDAGKLRGWATLKKILKDSGKTHQLVDHYVDKSGKRRWKGNANLRSSELGPQFSNACYFIPDWLSYTREPNKILNIVTRR